MAEMRFNPLTRDWVIIAPGRSQKPNAFRAAPTARPPRSQRAAAPDGSGLARVIPNKFPALVHSDDLCRVTKGTFRSMTAAGAHEVIVEHPRHDLTLAGMEPTHLAIVLRLYRDRYVALQQDPA